MLYVTTREKYDAFTPIRSLQTDHGPDGGRYFPYKMPSLTAQEVSALKEKSFGQTVADVLNLFFDCSLTSWDVEFVIGRYPVKVQPISQKILVAELWRNLEGSYEKLEKQLAERIRSGFSGQTRLTSWLRIAIRIAMLTALTGELQRQGITDPLDISVAEGDFTQVMALWYARQMGLPISNIICGCGDGSSAWELIHNGSLRDPAAMPELERLVRGTLGVDEAQRYGKAAISGASFALLPNDLARLRSGLFAAVISAERKNAAVPNVKNTVGYRIDDTVAVAYSALLDYRAKTGESRAALLLAERDPQGREQG